MKATFLFTLLTVWSLGSYAQHWQQEVDYQIDVTLDHQLNQLDGTIQLQYTNHSPDTLDRVYFHLYYNAFQPGSMMDVRSRSIVDPDKRVKDRIFHLKEDEIGYHKIKSLTYKGQSVNYTVKGTVMKVMLPQPILPKEKVQLDLAFNSQIPAQIRRTGRDNKEGIRYSMTQWYPKLAEYDRYGWHPHQYVAREFYSPWGDYDVKITIDSSYMVAAGGVLQNADQIGKGYSDAKPTTTQLTYHFKAENVHDFAWAADTAYVHEIVKMKEGLDFHYFYKNDTLQENWDSLKVCMKKSLPYIEEHFGRYPYPVYNIIQGGDGGMEYPMATLITGHRKFKSLLGVTVHEYMHSWYQMMLATSENYLYWMDEGFTTYATNMVTDFIIGDTTVTNPNASTYSYFRRLVEMGEEEPLTTHADHFETNLAYRLAAYIKGCVGLNQLKYVVGEEVFDKALLRYYDEWKFKHPDQIDFIRVFEKESGLELNWYLDFWVNTIKQIDYALQVVHAEGKKDTRIRLENKGQMPMPLDIKVTLEGDEVKWYHIPTDLTLGHKPLGKEWTLLSDWPWVNDYYSFTIPFKQKDVLSIEIAPSGDLADMSPRDNQYPLKSTELEIFGVEEVDNFE